MSENVLYQQLGKFVVMFQRMEQVLVELVVLMADANDEVIRILVTEIEFGRLVKSADVLFSYFVDVMRQPDEDSKARFHSLMNKCAELGQLRNALVHSSYAHLVDDATVIALVRENSKLKFKGGVRRHVEEEDLSAESFDAYFGRIEDVLTELESVRLKLIDWKYLL